MAEDIELSGLMEDPLEEAADEDAADEETSFSFQPIDAPEQEDVGVTVPSLQRELLQTAIDDYYTALVKLEGEPQLGSLKF